MKPKQRQLVFTVVRTFPQPTVLDTYATTEGADNKLGEYQQACLDKGITDFTFEVHTNCYYDE